MSGTDRAVDPYPCILYQCIKEEMRENELSSRDATCNNLMQLF